MTPAQAKQFRFLQQRVVAQIERGNTERALRIAKALASAVERAGGVPEPTGGNQSEATAQRPAPAAPAAPTTPRAPAVPAAPKPPVAPIAPPAPPGLPASPDASPPPAPVVPAAATPPAVSPEAKPAPKPVAAPALRDDEEHHEIEELENPPQLCFDIFFQAAELHWETDELDDADRMFREALQIVEAHGDEIAPAEVAHVHHNYASFNDQMGRQEAAEEHDLAALAILEEIDPPPLEQLANVSNNLAMVSRNRGDLPEAEERYLRALEMFEQLRGPDHLDVAVVCNNLGSLYWAWHHPDKARDLHLRALKIRSDQLASDHGDVGQSACNLAAVYHDLKAYDEATRHYKRGLKILHTHLSEDPESYRVVAENFADLLRETGHERKAEQLLRKIEKQLAGTGGDDPSDDED